MLREETRLPALDDSYETAAAAPSVPLLLRAMEFVRIHRRLIVLTAGTCALLAALGAAILPRKYDATASFTPSTRGTQGTLGEVAGLASQFGFQLDMGGSDDNIAFYVALLQSRALLLRTIETRYTVREENGEQRSGDLIQLLDVKGRTPGERRNRAVLALDKMISVRSNQQANIVQYKVSSRRPDLSEQIASRLWTLVNEFNLERRQTQASAERKFVQSRVDSAVADLASSEAVLAAFLSHNRAYHSSPELRMRFERLQRQVDFKQQVLTTLVQNLEKARMDEVRNVPVVTAIDSPVGSALRRPRGMVLSAILGLFFGLFLGAGIALWRRMVAAARVADPLAYH